MLSDADFVLRLPASSIRSALRSLMPALPNADLSTTTATERAATCSAVTLTEDPKATPSRYNWATSPTLTSVPRTIEKVTWLSSVLLRATVGAAGAVVSLSSPDREAATAPAVSAANSAPAPSDPPAAAPAAAAAPAPAAEPDAPAAAASVPACANRSGPSARMGCGTGTDADAPADEVAPAASMGASTGGIAEVEGDAVDGSGSEPPCGSSRVCASN